MTHTRVRDDYRSRLYHSYVTTHGAGAARERAEPTLVHDICRRLPSREARVLDVGCGAGDVVRLLRQAGYRDVHGVDASEEQVALAAERGIEGVEHGDLLDYLTASRDSFDAIVAVDVLEHFDKADVLEVLDAVFAALRPSGRLVARAPNGGSPFGGRILHGDFTHGTAFTQRSITQVLRATGFGQIAVFPTDPVVHGPVSLVRAALWKLIAAVLQFSLAVETGVVRGHIVTQNLIAVAVKSSD